MPLDLSKIEPLRSEPYPFNELQEAWLRDLETTDAPQGRSWLVDKGRYCCLGRLCVVAGLQEVNDAFAITDGDVSDFDPGKIVMTIASPSLRKQFRLRTRNGDFFQVAHVNGEPAGCLTGLNDRLKLTFKEIAAFIRHDPWNVFLSAEENGEALANAA